MPVLDYHNSHLQISFNEDNEWESADNAVRGQKTVLKQEDAHGIKVKVKKNMTLVFYKLVLLLNLQRGDIVNVLILN